MALKKNCARDLSGNFRNSYLGLAATTTAGMLVWLAEPGLRKFGGANTIS